MVVVWVSTICLWLFWAFTYMHQMVPWPVVSNLASYAQGMDCNFSHRVRFQAYVDNEDLEKSRFSILRLLPTFNRLVARSLGRSFSRLLWPSFSRSRVPRSLARSFDHSVVRRSIVRS